MKNKFFLVSLLSTALSAMTAGATITDITYKWDTNNDGLISSSESGINNNSPASNLTLLSSKVDLSSIGSTAISQPLSSYTGFYSGDRYAIVKWGPGQLGSGGVSTGYWQVFDILGGGKIDITTPPKVNNVSAGGISSIYTVPDGGSTLMLLGAALSAIVAARRKFGRLI